MRYLTWKGVAERRTLVIIISTKANIFSEDHPIVIKRDRNTVSNFLIIYFLLALWYCVVLFVLCCVVVLCKKLVINLLDIAFKSLNVAGGKESQKL